MTIAESIKRLRKSLNMTQKQLAEKTGIAQITIQQYEAGKYEPKRDNLIKLAKALNADIADIANDYYHVGQSSFGQVLTRASIRTEKIDEILLLNYYRQLNNTGKTEAQKRVGELTLIDVYKDTESQQHTNIIYSPGVSDDISSLAFYDEEKDIPNGSTAEPPQE